MRDASGDVRIFENGGRACLSHKIHLVGPFMFCRVDGKQNNHTVSCIIAIIWAYVGHASTIPNRIFHLAIDG